MALLPFSEAGVASALQIVFHDIGPRCWIMSARELTTTGRLEEGISSEATLQGQPQCQLTMQLVADMCLIFQQVQGV